MFEGRYVHQAEEYQGETGGDRIQAAIAAAQAEPGHNVVVVGPRGPDARGRWVLPRAIELPSHTTLLLLGAHLFLADRANDNLIRNRDPDQGNADIHVIGLGGARLDGNAENQDRNVRGRDVEIWMEKRGMPLARSTREVIGEMSVAEFESQRATQDKTLDLRNMGIHLYNVDNLTLRGFTIGPTNAWAIMPERVRNVLISDITLAQDGREPNQDGIHITGPSERIAISNVVGTCGDDAIALSSIEGDRGPITGVTVNNVVIRNRWCAGILRTVVARGYPIDGVYASNLQLLGGEGYSEAHAVLKLGNSRPGLFGLEQCMPEEHANITVENVLAKDWRGPYCAVFSPVMNLTIRGARGSHTGPFFHNFGQAVDGLILEDCRTTLKGGPEEPFVTGMIQFCLENTSYRNTLLTGIPAAIVLDGGPLKDVEIREMSLRSALKPGDKLTGTGIAGLRLAEGARVDSFRAAGLAIEGYETGIVIEDGIGGETLRFERVTMGGITTPWAIANADLVDSGGSIRLEP
jgi:hypothetical protein